MKQMSLIRISFSLILCEHVKKKKKKKEKKRTVPFYKGTMFLPYQLRKTKPYTAAWKMIAFYFNL
jgi:hypothetical protein